MLWRTLSSDALDFHTGSEILDDSAIIDNVYEDPFDDVFGDDTGSANSNEHMVPAQSANGDHLDISRLRSTHVTNGYREGIAESKATFVQEGFDEGYSLSAVIGFRVGWCLGVLEGLCHALDPSQAQSESISVTLESNKSLHARLSEAQGELSVQSLFGKEYFGSDGIWTYQVPGQDHEENVTFEEVSDAHPLLSKWNTVVSELALDIGLQLHSDGHVSRLEASADSG